MTPRDSIDEASRIVLTFSPGEEDVADGLDDASFRSYLRTAHAGSVQLGDEWEEFVSCGCGSTKDVTLRVQALTGGDAIGEETAIEYEAAK